MSSAGGARAAGGASGAGGGGGASGTSRDEALAAKYSAQAARCQSVASAARQKAAALRAAGNVAGVPTPAPKEAKAEIYDKTAALADQLGSQAQAAATFHAGIAESLAGGGQ